ncbi:hypothetical protein ES702_00522 [subsurface metagenome]
MDTEWTRSRVKASCVELFYHWYSLALTHLPVAHVRFNTRRPLLTILLAGAAVDPHRLLSFLFLRFVDSSLCLVPRRPSFVFLTISLALSHFSSFNTQSSNFTSSRLSHTVHSLNISRLEPLTFCIYIRLPFSLLDYSESTSETRYQPVHRNQASSPLFLRA